MPTTSTTIACSSSYCSNTTAKCFHPAILTKGAERKIGSTLNRAAASRSTSSMDVLNSCVPTRPCSTRSVHHHLSIIGRVSHSIILAGFAYAVFFHDFGQEDHVFMPVSLIPFFYLSYLPIIPPASTVVTETKGVVPLSEPGRKRSCCECRRW